LVAATGYNTGRRERIVRTETGSDKTATAAFNTVSAEYLQTLQIPLLLGREFTPRDDGNAPWTAIVNEAFAQRY
jgi:hypothetical protein